jgi:hypothetical protein
VVPPQKSIDLGDVGRVATAQPDARSLQKERMRGWLAAGLVLADFAVILVALLKGASPGDTAAYATPLTAFAGAAVGYYFGS